MRFGEITLRENQMSKRLRQIDEYGFDKHRYKPDRGDDVESIPRSAGPRLEYIEERKFSRDMQELARRYHDEDVGVIAQMQKEAKNEGTFKQMPPLGQNR